MSTPDPAIVRSINPDYHVALSILAQPDMVCCNKCGYFGNQHPDHPGCNYQALPTVVISKDLFRRLITTLGEKLSQPS